MVRELLNYAQAHYYWPQSKMEDLSIKTFGIGAPVIAIGTLPHPNEPLGSSIVSYLEPIAKKFKTSILLIENLDPTSKAFQFPLPCPFAQYLQKFYLAPLSKQVEFSYCRMPQTNSQKRAHRIEAVLKKEKIKLFLLLHNDPFADYSYFFAHQCWKQLESVIYSMEQCPSEALEIPEVPFTTKVSSLTYRYFPIKNLDSNIVSEAAGIYLQEKLGIEIVTLESPMFDWKYANKRQKHKARKLHHKIWREQIPIMERKLTISTIFEDKMDLGAIPMIAPELNAQRQVEVLQSLLKTLL